jgi:hypothetical protein
MPRASTERRADERRGDGGGRGGARVLSRSTLMTVRRVLHAYREGWLLEERLAAAARMMAEDARMHGGAAEQMLVALEREWAALDDARRLPAHDARELLSRLVTLGIRAYYARDRSTGRGGRRTPNVGDGGARTAA